MITAKRHRVLTKSLELRKDFNTRLVFSLKFFDTLVGGPALEPAN